MSRWVFVLQAWYAAAVSKDAAMRTEPVAALHVLGRPGKEQLTEPQTGDEHIGLTDLTARELNPFERVAGVVHFHALAWREFARRDVRLAILRKFAVDIMA